MMKQSALILFFCIALGCTACGDDELSIQTTVPSETGLFLDVRDGKEYGYVALGSLEWITTNACYDVGDESLCRYYVAYEDRETALPADRWSAKYGLLYTQEGAQRSVPDGWRLPTDDDWKQLERTLGMSASEADGRGWRGTVQGRLMQETDEGCRLGMQLAGYYTPYVVGVAPRFRMMGSNGFFWSSTPDESKTGEYYFYRKLFYNSAQVYRESMEPEAMMLSVRWVRDAQ